MSCEQFCPRLAAHCSKPVALGIAAASFASGSGKWDSGTGILEFGDIFERGKIKRAKIERKARRVAERPKKANDKRLMAKELRN